MKRWALIVSIVLACLWALSVPMSLFFTLTSSGPTFGLGAGAFSLLLGRPNGHGLRPGPGLERIDRTTAFPQDWPWRLTWMPEWGATSGQYRLPVWIPFTLGVGWLVYAVRRRVRRPGDCPCGYEVGTLPVCPECGRPSTNMPSSSRHSA